MGSVKVAFFGVRGSFPVFRSDTSYGVNTSCVLVSTDDTAVMIDCGSGAYAAGRLLCSDTKMSHVSVLLSHMHLDHIMGIPCCDLFHDKGKTVDVWTRKRGKHTAKQQLETYMGAPYWPVNTDVFGANVTYNTFEEDELLALYGNIKVDTMASNHPNECTGFRLNIGDKSIVYALDFEHSLEATPRLIEFARGCDLLIYDAAYTDEIYKDCVGWGHSTWSMGRMTGELCGAKRVALSHFAYSITDSELDEEAKRLGFECDQSCFPAREGMTIDL